MNVIILGSGSVIPTLKRAQSSILLKKGKDLFLFDAGSGTLGQLLKAGADYRKINYMFFTHTHPDHINDLVAYLIAHKTKSDPRKKALYLFGPHNLKDFINKLKELYPVLEELPFKLKIKELRKSKFNLKGMKIKTLPMKHTENSIGYRIESKGKRVVYTGDTGFSANVLKLAMYADLLITECSYPNSMRKRQRSMNTHLIPELCAEIATIARVKKLLLLHFYPEADKANIKKQTKKGFKGKVIIAKDLMEVKV